MAARRIADHSEDDAAPFDAQFDDVSKLVDDQERMENEINAEIGAPDNEVRWMIKVYRVEATGKELTYLFQIIGESIEGLSDKLRDEYGTGKYMARVYKNSKLHKAPVFKVEAAKNRVPTAAPDHNGSALVQAVTQQGQVLQSLVTRLMTAPPPAAAPAQSMTEMMMGLAAMMKAMREINPLPPPLPPPPDPMAIMSSAIDMARSLADNDRPKSMMEVVGEFMQSDLMKTVVTNAQQQQGAQPAQIQQRPPQRPQIPAQPGAAPPTGAAPTPAPAPAPSPSEDEAKFSALLTMLLTRAEKNSDPVLWADAVEDLVDRQALEGLLSLPDPVGMLAQYNPAVATYREWFAQLIEALTDTGDGVDREGALDTIGSAPHASGVAPAPVPADGTP